MTWGLLTEGLRNRYFQVLVFYHDKLSISPILIPQKFSLCMFSGMSLASAGNFLK